MQAVLLRRLGRGLGGHGKDGRVLRRLDVVRRPSRNGSGAALGSGERGGGEGTMVGREILCGNVHPT